MRAFFCLLLATAASGAAAQSSPWYLGTALSVNHDNNILRLGLGQPPPGGESRFDTVTSLALVGGIDQPVGRQRYTGSVTLRDNRFERNDKYNNQSYSGSLGWQGSTINRISYSLSAGAARALSTFNADGVGVLTSRNYETTRGLNGSVSVGVVTEWSLEVSAGTRKVRNSLDDPLVLSRDFDQNNASVGLSWQPSSLLNVGLGVREVQGTFPRFRSNNGVDEEDRFKQQSLELSTRWQAGGASVLEARLASGDTGYKTNAARDFNSTSGTLAWSWQATGRVRVTSSLARDDGRDNYPSTIFGFIPITLTDRRVIDTTRIQADWEATGKVAVSSSLQLSRRSVERERFLLNGNPAAGVETGVDNTSIFTISARWAPQRSTVVGCELRDERRAASGTITSDLRGRSFSCYTQFTLQ